MHVLIADENPAAARTLATLLEDWGYEPVIVHDGPSAFAALRAQGAPPLAVLDWHMPGMNGDVICSAIRKDTQRPYTYIVLVNDQGGREQMIDGLEEGADALPRQPVNHPPCRPGRSPEHDGCDITCESR